MNYYDSMEKVIDYIENNLEEEIKLEKLARVACMSQYHFHRIFLAVTGETPMKYIRKRRLTRASYDLIKTEKSIIEISFEYGYESQGAFTRSFKSMFGVTPKRYRLDNRDRFLTIKSKINLEKLKKEKEVKVMNYKIVEREKMILLGMECTTSLRENKAENTLPKLWSVFSENVDRIKNRINDREYFGVCGEIRELDPSIKMDDDMKFKYLAGVEVGSVEDIPEGMKTIEIPKQRYIVYTHRGELDKLEATYKAIYSKWLPNTEFELSKAYDFEFYDERFTGPVEADSELDIYIPIK